MKIAVIGSGYVGLVTGACFAEYGVNVACLDIDKNKIDLLNSGGVPIYEPGLEDLIKKNVDAGRLTFSTNIPEGVRNALVVFIAVGTPEKEDGSADLQHVMNVAKTIAPHINDYKVIVTKSTVPVGTGRKVRKVICENQPEPVEFGVASNPEFLREGSAITDFMRPDRVVIGTEDERAEKVMKDLYNPLYLIEVPFVITNLESSELIKYASNAFLAVKISFINEVANICDAVGADVHKVAKGMGLDGRISAKFLHPGPGFGGSCFPKDTKALVDIARQNNLDSEIVNAAVSVNTKRPALMVKKIETILDGELSGKTIGLLGLSFKPNTDDMREAPSLFIVKMLQEKGAQIKAFDPVAMENAGKYMENVIFCSNEYETVEGCDAMVIVTEWNQFRKLDLARIKDLLVSPVLVDLRNVYEPEDMAAKGFKYVCVGR